MPGPLINASGVVICAHGGKTQLKGDPKCIAGGSPVVRLDDLIGAPIGGCTQVGDGKVPCTVVVTITNGITKKMQSSTGPYITQDLVGVTNGVPVNALSCVSAGQNKAIEI
jgi:hypothetical protein